MPNDISGVLISQSLKNVQNGLTAQDTALNTQKVMLFGADGKPNGKVPLSTDAVIDLKTGQKLSDVLAYIKPAPSTDLYVDMGLPSGLLWAKRNIDVTQANGFAASEYQYECSFFSWGNTQGHNPVEGSQGGNNAFAAADDFGGINAEEPWYQGQIYGSTPGADITANLGPSADGARASVGAPWRLPSTSEFAELFDNIDYIDADGNVVTTSTPSVDANARGANDKRVIVNSIVGLRLRSKINGNILFFPASGLGNGRTWNSRGANGFYWSSSWISSRNARGLGFNSGGVSPQGTVNRYNGFALRPVQ